MPGVVEALTFLVLSAQAGALGAGLAAVAGLYGTTLLSIAVSVGASLLSAALRPKPPGPEDVQQSFRNPIAPRVRHYGRVKISGPWVFAESKNGNFYKVIALGTGELDAIEELWVDDHLVTVDGSGWVNSGYPFNNSTISNLRIQYRLGLASETHYSALESVFPEWDSDHVGNGVSSLFATQIALSAENVGGAFPNLANTLYRVVARGSKVYNVSTASTIWADDAASIIRDYLTHPDGMRLPSALVNTTQAAAGWLAAYDTCTENIPLNAGGTEDRYRLWGSYRFDERPGDVVARMLACCDGRLVPTPDGGLTLDPGVFQEPTVTLDEDTIVGFSELSRGRDVRTTANTIRASFLSPDHDFQSTDADPWVDEDDVSERGEIVQEHSFIMAPSHTQARRLMKIASYRANPNWIGSFACNLKGLAALGQRFVRVTYPAFGIDEVFEIQSFRFDIGEGGILHGVTIAVASMPEEAYEWDETTEEGEAPIAESTTVDRTIPVPSNFTVTQVLRNFGGSNYPVAFLDWDDTPSDALLPQARGRKTSVDSPADEPWVPISIAEGESSADSFILEDGEDYEYQVRYITLTGRTGEWTASETLTPISDPTPPNDLVDFDIVGGPEFIGHVPMTFTTAIDEHLKRIAIYAVPSGGVLDTDDPSQLLLRLTGVPTGSTFAYTYGDSGISPDIQNDMSASTGWSLGTGFSIGSGVMTATAGTASIAARTPAAFSAGDVWRMAIDASLASGSYQFRLGGGVAQLSTAISSSGRGLGKVTAVSGNTSVGILKDASLAGTFDNFVAYKETPACAPQGHFDLYAVPENGSGIEGDPFGPIAVTVI
jgi:hypothetical protein